MKGDTDNQLCAEVNARGSYFLETAQYLDCKFLVGVEPQQEVIASNKQILAMASQVFEAMLYGDLSEKSYPIHIIDIQPETFKLLLQYICTGNMKVNSVDEACDLYYAAKKYMLQHLLEECSRYLRSHVDTSNVWQLFELAELYEDKYLLLKCENIFSMDTLDALNASKFEDAELNTVLTVFSYDTLNIDSETHLIKAAARYAKAHNIAITERGADQSPSDEPLISHSDPPTLNSKANGVKAENGPELVAETVNVGDAHNQLVSVTQAVDPGAPAFEESPKIKRLVAKLRFLCLTAQQFTECSERSSILTMSEDYVVLMNLSSKKCNVPLPRGFSTSRLARNVVTKFGNEGEGEARVKGWFQYKICDFIYVENASSPPYYVRNLPWRLNMTRNEEDRPRISVQCCGQNDLSWSCEVKLTLKVISAQGTNHYTLTAFNLFCKESDTICFHGTKSIVWDGFLTRSGAVFFELHIESS